MKIFERKCIAAWTLASLLATAPVFAEDKSIQEKTTQDRVMPIEEQAKIAVEQSQRMGILGHLHHINLKEIQLSKMAQDKSQSKQVKDFAQQMIMDHQNADRKVMEIADAENMKLPDFQLAGYEKAASDHLEKLKGMQFDQVFLSSMDLGHKMVAQELEIARAAIRDPQIVSLIDSVLPTFREHQRMAARYEKSESQMAGQSGMTGK